MGNLTGSGVIANNNALDFKMLLKISGAAANTLGSLTQISSGVQGVQNHGLPFTITGTTQNPRFMPALGNELKSGLKDTFLGAVQGTPDQSGNQAPTKDLKKALGGIFGKKKP